MSGQGWLTLNGFPGSLEAQANILVPPHSTLAWHLLHDLLAKAAQKTPQLSVHTTTLTQAVAGPLEKAYPTFTPSCFWNPFSPCQKQTDWHVGNRPSTRSSQLLIDQAHLLSHADVL